MMHRLPQRLDLGKVRVRLRYGQALRRPTGTARCLATAASDNDGDSPVARAAALLWDGDGRNGPARAMRSLVADARAAHDEKMAALSSGAGMGSDAGRELAALSEVVELADAVAALSGEIASLAEMMEDEELGVVAVDEATELAAKRAEMGAALVAILMKRAKGGGGDGEEREVEGAIVEVRAGTGGDEAALFAAELLNMYEKYARASGWSSELLSVMKAHETGGKIGIKEAVLAVRVIRKGSCWGDYCCLGMQIGQRACKSKS